MKKLCTLFMLLWLLLFSFSSCRTSTTTIQPHAVDHKIDTISLVMHHVDSVYIHDSIMVQKTGDTVYFDRWHTAYKYKYIYRDSIHVRIDSIPYPVEVIKEVPYTPRYKNILSFVGAASIILLIAYIFLRRQFS